MSAPQNFPWTRHILPAILALLSFFGGEITTAHNMPVPECARPSRASEIEPNLVVINLKETSSPQEGQTASGAMVQILDAVQDGINEKQKADKNPCDRAALNMAWYAINDAWSGGYLGGFLKAIKSALSNIWSLGKEGLEKYLKDKLEEGKEAVKDAIKDWLKEKLQGTPPETFAFDEKKDSCDIHVQGTLDIAARTFKFLITGDCHCNPVNSAEAGGKQFVQLSTFAVIVTGTLSIDIDYKTYSPVIYPDASSVKVIVRATCQTCTQPKTTTQPGQPQTPPPPVQPEKPSTTNPPPASTPPPSSQTEKPSAPSLPTQPPHTGTTPAPDKPKQPTPPAEGGSANPPQGPSVPPAPPIPPRIKPEPPTSSPIVPRAPLPSCWPAGTDVKAACQPWLKIAQANQAAANLAAEALANAETELAALNKALAEWNLHITNLQKASDEYAAMSKDDAAKAAAANDPQLKALWSKFSSDADAQSKALAAQAQQAQAQADAIKAEVNTWTNIVAAAKADLAAKQAAAAASMQDYDACLKLPACPQPGQTVPAPPPSELTAPTGGKTATGVAQPPATTSPAPAQPSVPTQSNPAPAVPAGPTTPISPSSSTLGALTCAANVAVPPQLRSEGMTELIGDIVINCTPGSPRTAVGQTSNPSISLTIEGGTIAHPGQLRINFPGAPTVTIPGVRSGPTDTFSIGPDDILTIVNRTISRYPNPNANSTTPPAAQNFTIDISGVTVNPAPDQHEIHLGLNGSNGITFNQDSGLTIPLSPMVAVSPSTGGNATSGVPDFGDRQPVRSDEFAPGPKGKLNCPDPVCDRIYGDYLKAWQHYRSALMNQRHNESLYPTEVEDTEEAQQAAWNDYEDCIRSCQSKIETTPGNSALSSSSGANITMPAQPAAPLQPTTTPTPTSGNNSAGATNVPTGSGSSNPASCFVSYQPIPQPTGIGSTIALGPFTLNCRGGAAQPLNIQIQISEGTTNATASTSQALLLVDEPPPVLTGASGSLKGFIAGAGLVRFRAKTVDYESGVESIYISGLRVTPQSTGTVAVPSITLTFSTEGQPLQFFPNPITIPNPHAVVPPLTTTPAPHAGNTNPAATSAAATGVPDPFAINTIPAGLNTATGTYNVTGNSLYAPGSPIRNAPVKLTVQYVAADGTIHEFEITLPTPSSQLLPQDPTKPGASLWLPQRDRPNAADGWGGSLQLAAFHSSDPSESLSSGTLVRMVTRPRPNTRHATRATPQVAGAPEFNLIANGNASGEAFEFQVFDPTGKLKEIRVPDGLILEPLERGSVQPVAAKPGQKKSSHKLSAYCVNYDKDAPEPNGLYRIAAPEIQEQYKPIRSVIRAGRELAAAGKFHPDSDLAAYILSIRQYALWTKLENWNEQQFADVFVEKTRRIAAESKVEWDKDMEKAVRALVPGRWRDISLVLEEARKLEAAAALPPAR